MDSCIVLYYICITQCNSTSYLHMFVIVVVLACSETTRNWLNHTLYKNFLNKKSCFILLFLRCYSWIMGVFFTAAVKHWKSENTVKRSCAPLCLPCAVLQLVHRSMKVRSFVVSIFWFFFYFLLLLSWLCGMFVEKKYSNWYLFLLSQYAAQGILAYWKAMLQVWFEVKGWLV